MKNQYFKLFSYMLPVKGKERSAIYSLRRGTIKFVPNSMFDILNRLEGEPLTAVRASFDEEEQSIFDEYLDFLFAERMGFVTDEPERFPKYSMEWDEPSHILNASLDYQFDHYDIKAVFESLQTLLCKHIEIRITKPLENIHQLRDLLDSLKGTVVRSVCLFLKSTPKLNDQDVDRLFTDYAKLSELIIYDHPVSQKSLQYPEQIFYLKEDLEESTFKAHYPPTVYVINPRYFTEAQYYNPFYNRKLAIDAMGQLRNAHTCRKAFGHVDQIDLREVIMSEEFQEYWFASPDKIENIKDSELRYCLHLSYDLEKTAEGTYRFVGLPVEEEYEFTAADLMKNQASR